MNRNCKSCLSNKPIDQFYKHSCGYRHTCKKCDGEKAAQWAKENPIRRLEIVKKSRAKEGNAWKNYRSEWRKGSGEVAKRRASIANRTPAWLSEDDFWIIREIYELRLLRDQLTNAKWHVDHVVPLRGKLVSGLHVPSNLQVITAEENVRKHNLHFQLKEI